MNVNACGTQRKCPCTRYRKATYRESERKNSVVPAGGGRHIGGGGGRGALPYKSGEAMLYDRCTVAAHKQYVSRELRTRAERKYE